MTLKTPEQIAQDVMDAVFDPESTGTVDVTETTDYQVYRAIVAAIEADRAQRAQPNLRCHFCHQEIEQRELFPGKLDWSHVETPTMPRMWSCPDGQHHAEPENTLLHEPLTSELHDKLLTVKKVDVDLAELDDQIQSAMEGFDTKHGFFPSIDRWNYQKQEVVDTVLEQYGIDPE